VNPWLGIAAVCGTLVILLAMVGGLGRWCGWPAELSRKVVHVTMGLVCLSFPWVFDEAWAVGVLALVASAGLFAIREIPALRARLGGALHGVRRSSLGELLFAPAVALVFWLSQGRVELFLAPVLVLALADAAGALAGTRWGRSRYGSGSGWKSVEGSAAFLLLAIACVAGPLLAAGRLDPEKVVWIALSVGLLATMAEGLSDGGSDNLVLPLWVFFLLERFVGMDERMLVVRCGIVVAVLLVVVLGGRWSTLDGAALLAAGLLGYGLAILGGPWFLAPALAVFAVHLVTSWQGGLGKELRHGREPVFGVALATLPWAAARPWIGHDAALLGCAVGAAAMLMMLHVGTRRYLCRKGLAPCGCAAKLALVMVPALWVIGRSAAWWVALAGLVLAVAASWAFDRVSTVWGRDAVGIRLTRGGFALAPSLVALWISGP